MDSLVEKTVTNLGCSSFVYDVSLNTVEHRFLSNCRTLDTGDRAYLNDKGTMKRESVKLEAVPYGMLFQAVCVDGEWILASPNNCNLNHM